MRPDGSGRPRACLGRSTIPTPLRGLPALPLAVTCDLPEAFRRSAGVGASPPAVTSGNRPGCRRCRHRSRLEVVHTGVRIGPWDAAHEDAALAGFERGRGQVQPARHLLGRDVAGLDPDTGTSGARGTLARARGIVSPPFLPW